MKITALGHAGFIFDDGKRVVIDPFLTGNPVAKLKPTDVKPVDVVVVTHGHPDHLGDAFAIVKNTGATLVSSHEVATSGEIAGEGMNFGGTMNIRGLPFTMVKAEHSVGVGDSAGFVWSQGGKVIYHMGDTSIFSDMKLHGEIYKPEVLLVPIGDRYTMNPRDAAMATAWINPKFVIPMHYKTFPFLVQDANDFQNRVKATCLSTVLVLEPGQSVDL